jgi:hypothetical protein
VVWRGPGAIGRVLRLERAGSPGMYVGVVGPRCSAGADPWHMPGTVTMSIAAPGVAAMVPSPPCGALRVHPWLQSQQREQQRPWARPRSECDGTKVEQWARLPGGLGAWANVA